MKRYFMLWLMILAGSSLANEGGGGGAADLLKLDTMIITLREGHYLQFTPHVKLLDAKTAELVKAYTPVLRHELIKALIGRDHIVVATGKFMDEFSREAADTLNKALHDDYVKELFFEGWLVQ